MTILFIFERFLTCKYCTYASGSYKVGNFNFYSLLLGLSFTLYTTPQAFSFKTYDVKIKLPILFYCILFLIQWVMYITVSRTLNFREWFLTSSFRVVIKISFSLIL